MAPTHTHTLTYCHTHTYAHTHNTVPCHTHNTYYVAIRDPVMTYEPGVSHTRTMPCRNTSSCDHYHSLMTQTPS